jgi:hypothetical protein
MRGAFGSPQLTAGIGADNVSASDVFNDENTGLMERLGILMDSGAGKVTPNRPSGDTPFRTPHERGLNIFGGPPADARDIAGAKDTSISKLGLDKLKGNKGIFAAGLINDAFKRMNPHNQRLEQVNLATKHLAGDGLLEANKRGLGGHDPVTDISDYVAIDKLQQRRDEERQAKIDFLRSKIRKG